MKHILNFNKWSLLESEEFKVYTLPNRPNHVYRRSGKDAAGNPKWQYQEKDTKKKDEWFWVENEESIKALKAQYDANLKKQKSSSNSNAAASAAASTVSSAANPQDYWTLITIMACENYSDQPQGMADVAQSIYNRFNTKGQPYGKSITEIILSAGQYEPVKIGKGKGAKWDSIKSKESAIVAYLKTKGVDRTKAEAAINAAINAQKNSTLIANAKSHVGSRTEFLASSPTDSKAKGAIERSPSDKHNTFFWNYAGKTNYYDVKQLAATPKPDSVKIG
jgi:hypothetical protein